MSLPRLLLMLSLPLLLAASAFAQVRSNSAPSNQLVTIRGRVVDAETGAAVLDARVSLSGVTGGGLSGSQSTMGSEFEFDNIPTQGNYEIVVEADGYRPVRQPFQASYAIGGPFVIPLVRIKFVEKPAVGSAVSARLLQLPAEARDAYQNGMTQLYDKHDAQKSLAFFDKTLKLAPTFYEANYQLGMAYQDLKRTPEAESAFRDAMKASDGKFAPPAFSLASLLSMRQSFAEAESLARKGLQSDPKSASGHYELARALLGQGKADEAETEAKTSLELGSAIPQNYLLLAAIAANRGQPAGAVKDLDKYLEAVPDGPLTASVRSMRENLRQQAGLPKEEAERTNGPAKPQ